VKGRAMLLREWAKMIDIDLSEILPESEAELTKLMAKFAQFEQNMLPQSTKKGTLPNPSNTTGQIEAPRKTDPDGKPAGGVESNAFQNQEGITQ
jgi:hypothetical protein